MTLFHGSLIFHENADENTRSTINALQTVFIRLTAQPRPPYW